MRLHCVAVHCSDGVVILMKNLVSLFICLVFVRDYDKTTCVNMLVLLV